MAYKALYRAYRPSTFDEVAGQQHIVRTLKNALASGKIAHAYLFAGPRGTGKTTMAKLFAKALNCDHGIGGQCNECKNCVAINDGSHPDVLELDAASNNGVNQIREIIDRVKYGTIQGRYKVYIIDEVHMLSDAAFNALLKTLEEPPSHVVFILATTEPHEILPTILSRCQRYDFTKVSDEDIIARMKIILKSENIEYEEEATELIATLAEGGMRDALSMLDQVLAFSENNTLKTEDVLSIFSLESTGEKVKLLDNISSNNTSEVLSTINSYFTKGTDIKRLTDDLLIILKDVLLYSISSKAEYLQKLSEAQASSLANKCSTENINAMINILMAALKDYQNVPSINPIFEVTILKLCALFAGKYSPKVEKVIREEIVEEEKEDKIIEEPKQETTQYIPQEEIIELEGALNGDHYEISDEKMIEVMVSSDKNKKKDITAKWGDIKKYTMDASIGNVASALVGAHPLVASSKMLVLEFQMAATAERMNQKDKQKELQSAVLNTCGIKVFVYCIDRKRSVDLQLQYSSLLQIGRLPKKDNINLVFKGE